jgi:hypothetical protein
MKTHGLQNTVYAVSANVVVRKVEDEVVLIPLVTHDDHTENEPFFLNTTGQAIFRMFNGKRKLKDIVAHLAADFNCPAGVIENDVIAFVKDLLKKKLLADVSET